MGNWCLLTSTGGWPKISASFEGKVSTTNQEVYITLKHWRNGSSELKGKTGGCAAEWFFKFKKQKLD